MSKPPGTGSNLAGSASLDYSSIVVPARENIESKNSWNKPKANFFLTLAAFWGFMIMGLHNPAFGALLPYIGTYYDLSYTVMSLIFIPNLCGYVAATIATSYIHHYMGRRGIAIIAPLCMISAYAIICIRPPFTAIIFCFVLISIGCGLQDAAWNAYVGNLKNATEVLGFLHGLYGLGAIVGPMIATVMVTKSHLSWFTYYVFMLFASCTTLATSVPAFWSSTGAQYRSSTGTDETSDHPTPTDSARQESFFHSLFGDPRTSRILCLNILFFLFYGGVENVLIGWTTTYMLRIRQADPFVAGLFVSGIWLGLSAGRMVLGFITPRLGVYKAIAGYAVMVLLLELLFAVVTDVWISAVIVILQGFLLGPMFPAGVEVLTSKLPPKAHVQGLGFTFSCGAIGSACFPFLVGALAETFSLKVYVPILLVMLVLMLSSWTLLSRAAAVIDNADATERESLLRQDTTSR